jgi:predicted DNA-binding transcriptional regulator AlpA
MHSTVTTDTTPRPTVASLGLEERDAARYICYTQAALRSWRRKGRGPAYIRYGRSVRYLRSDLDAWLARHRVEPTEAK